MDITQFGWRDTVLLLAAGLGVYVALTLLRLSQIGRRKRGDGKASRRTRTLFAGFADKETASSADQDTRTEDLGQSPDLAASACAAGIAPAFSAELPFAFPSPPGYADIVAPPLAGSRPPDFSDALDGRRLEQEVEQLRAEVTALRDELRDLQAARRVAPHYADAMALARRGYDARGIAEQCGIAQGEAELVMALARGADDLQAENDHVGFERPNRILARG